jgi:hypothetical protein
MKIHVVYFDSKTLAEQQASGDKKIHSAERMNTFTAGDICLLTDLDKRCFVGFAVLKGTCALSDLLDVEVYSGEDAKYNKYEFPLECYWILPEPVSFETIATHCGGSVADATRTNLFTGVAMERSEVFYGKKGDSSLILDRYRCLVASWSTTSPCTPCTKCE